MANNNNNNNNNAQGPNKNIKFLEFVKDKWGTEAPSVIVERIGKGHRWSTEALAISPNAKYRAQVVQAGAVDKLLGFILKTNKPFEDIVEPGEETISCPSVWLNVLSNFCRDDFLQPESLCRDVQYKIVINMAGLFQDMSNFEERHLYQSRDVWIKSLMFFTNMLDTLFSSNFGRMGAFLMRQVQLLKAFLVRTMFLEISDPSIAQEILEFAKRDDRMPAPDILGLSRTYAACCLKTILVKYAGASAANPSGKSTAKPNPSANKMLIPEVAGTPIRPEHELRLMTGIMDLLRMKPATTTPTSPGWYQGGFSATLAIFMILYDKADRLSGPFGVESAAQVMVEACRNHLSMATPYARDRFFAENVLTGLIAIGSTLVTPNVGGKQAPMDYNIAMAVKGGVFDYICECCDANDPRVATALVGLIRTIHSTSLLEDTPKAIKELAPSIAAKIDRVKDRHPLLLPPLGLVKQILEIPDIGYVDESDRCEFCQEKITPDSLEKCPFCKTVCYCSKDCQRLNWMIHQSDCAERRKEPKAVSLEEQMDKGKKLFAQHISKLLLQAALKGRSIVDCVVTIDMCEATPLLIVYTLEQFSASYIQDEAAAELSEQVLERNKKDGSLTASFVGFSETEGFNANLMTIPPSSAPQFPAVTKAAPADKWRVAQQSVAASTLGQGAGAQMQKNPKLYQLTLMKTIKP